MAELEEERNSASHFSDISAVKPEGMEWDMGEGMDEMDAAEMDAQPVTRKQAQTSASLISENKTAQS